MLQLAGPPEFIIRSRSQLTMDLNFGPTASYSTLTKECPPVPLLSFIMLVYILVLILLAPVHVPGVRNPRLSEQVAAGRGHVWPAYNPPG